MMNTTFSYQPAINTKKPVKNDSPVSSPKQALPSSKEVSFTGEKTSSNPLFLTMASLAAIGSLAIAKPALSQEYPAGDQYFLPQTSPGLCTTENDNLTVHMPPQVSDVCLQEKMEYYAPKELLFQIDQMFAANPEESVANINIPGPNDTEEAYNQKGISIVKHELPTDGTAGPEDTLYTVNIFTAQKTAEQEEPEVRFVELELNQHGKIWNSRSDVELSAQQAEDLLAESLAQVKQNYDAEVANGEEDFPNFEFGGDGSNPWGALGGAAGAIAYGIAKGLGPILESLKKNKNAGKSIIKAGESLAGTLGKVGSGAAAAVRNERRYVHYHPVFINYYGDIGRTFKRYEDTPVFRPKRVKTVETKPVERYKAGDPKIKEVSKDFLADNLLATNGYLNKQFTNDMMYLSIEPAHSHKVLETIIERADGVTPRSSEDKVGFKAYINQTDYKGDESHAYVFELKLNGEIASIEKDGKVMLPSIEDTSQENILLNSVMDYIHAAAEAERPELIFSKKDKIDWNS